MTRFMTLASAVVLALCIPLGGCGGHSFEMATPPGFVVLKDQEPNYDYRATTADGVVIAVREIKHEPKGDLSFWVQAVRNKLRAMSGYALLETVDVSTRAGLKGTQLRFGHDEKGEPWLYYVTVFVTDKMIYVLEFGGSKEQLTRFSAQLQWVTDNFRTN